VILSTFASEKAPSYKGLELTCEEDADVRIFGKPTTRVGRRMGVVVVNAPVGTNIDEVRDKAKRLADAVEVIEN
jgi:phosphoribosylglycinamide formyltransferase 2